MEATTYETASGNRIKITPLQEATLKSLGVWPRNYKGEEYSSVHKGLAACVEVPPISILTSEESGVRIYPNGAKFTIDKTRLATLKSWGSAPGLVDIGLS